MGETRSKGGHDARPVSCDAVGACLDAQLALPRQGLQWRRALAIPIAYDGAIITERCVDFVIWDGGADERLLESRHVQALSTVLLPSCGGGRY